MGHTACFNFQPQLCQGPCNLYFQQEIKRDILLSGRILKLAQRWYEFSQNQNQITSNIFPPLLISFKAE